MSSRVRNNISPGLLLSTASQLSLLNYEQEYWTAFRRFYFAYLPFNVISIIWAIFFVVAVNNHFAPRYVPFANLLLVYLLVGLLFAYCRSSQLVYKYEQVRQMPTKIASDVRSTTIMQFLSLCRKNVHLADSPPGLASLLERAVVETSSCGPSYRNVASNLSKEISSYDQDHNSDKTWKVWSPVVRRLCSDWIEHDPAASTDIQEDSTVLSGGPSLPGLSESVRQSARNDLLLSIQLLPPVSRSPSLLLFWWKRQLVNQLESVLYASCRTPKQYQVGKWLVMACIFFDRDYFLVHLQANKAAAAHLAVSSPFAASRLYGGPAHRIDGRNGVVQRGFLPGTTTVTRAAATYEAITKRKPFYTLSDNMLKFNSYPRFVNGRCGEVSILGNSYDKKFRKKIFAADSDLERECVRCKQSYTLRANNQSSTVPCRYHLGGIDKNTGFGGEKVYSCCGQVVGCQKACCHVTSTVPHKELFTFVSAPPPLSMGIDPRSKQVLALDCEMVFTMWGPALARVTAVDIDCKVVLDVIVRPSHEVVDYNTTFSGITKQMIDGARCSLQQAQQMLFDVMNSETILVGHSLESDLKAMRIVHDRVIDTSILFPRSDGSSKNKKRSLKELSRELLGISIQTAGSAGHDSKEDAAAAMRLLMLKLRTDGRIAF